MWSDVWMLFGVNFFHWINCSLWKKDVIVSEVHQWVKCTASINLPGFSSLNQIKCKQKTSAVLCIRVWVLLLLLFIVGFILFTHRSLCESKFVSDNSGIFFSTMRQWMKHKKPHFHIDYMMRLFCRYAKIAWILSAMKIFNRRKITRTTDVIVHKQPAARHGKEFRCFKKGSNEIHEDFRARWFMWLQLL